VQERTKGVNYLMISGGCKKLRHGQDTGKHHTNIYYYNYYLSASSKIIGFGTIN
jgi:hypothetical protein